MCRKKTLFNWRLLSACRHPAHHKELLEWVEPSNAPLTKPSYNNAGPIVCCPMGLSVPTGCDTAWDQTPGCSDAATLQCSALDHCATREVSKCYFDLQKETISAFFMVEWPDISHSSVKGTWQPTWSLPKGLKTMRNKKQDSRNKKQDSDKLVVSYPSVIESLSELRL